MEQDEEVNQMLTTGGITPYNQIDYTYSRQERPTESIKQPYIPITGLPYAPADGKYPYMTTPSGQQNQPYGG